MSDPVIAVAPLGAPPWPTIDPFLFLVHHLDVYPPGNDAMGPDASLDGRNIGMDFAGKDGWRMYHGDVIPGFPRHPHRGFETVTIARQGFIDHSDSLGATARFGNGDCQWMTAGKGVVHSEMFPLIRQDQANPTELFQLWLNLPSADKMADPHFAMLWADTVPVVELAAGVTARVYAGALGDVTPPAPPPSSWAARASAGVAIWELDLAAGATVTLPPGPADAQRVLYAYRGNGLTAHGHRVSVPSALQARPGATLTLQNGDAPSGLLLLQGRPIGEPVAKHGPFVMNTRDEIRAAMRDYQRTQFGGWPWPSDGPAHDRAKGRFALHADGTREDAP
jgi:hypothetical protein